MAWVKASDLKPQDGEQVLIYDEKNLRIEVGRYTGGRWYVEDSRDGGLREIAGVSHWGPLLDSEDYDAGDD